MNGQHSQPPVNLWEAILIMFRWACRIPLACLFVLTLGCGAFLGFMFVLRLTVWVFDRWLAHWW